MASDPFSTLADSATAPARRCFTITPHDTNEVAIVTKAIRSGGDGTVTLRAVDSDADVAHPVRNGERIDVRVRFVRATGTNVSLIGYA